MYLVISKCVTAVKVSKLSGHYLLNRSTLDIGVLGYIGIVQHKEHSPEVLSIPSGTPCIHSTASDLSDGLLQQNHKAVRMNALIYRLKKCYSSLNSLHVIVTMREVVENTNIHIYIYIYMTIKEHNLNPYIVKTQIFAHSPGIPVTVCDADICCVIL